MYPPSSSAMLNTIYEEFDFESKIKDLKNKKIKIKLVQRSRDENSSQVFSQVFAQPAEKLQPTSQPQIMGKIALTEPMSLKELFHRDTQLATSRILSEISINQLPVAAQQPLRSSSCEKPVFALQPPHTVAAQQALVASLSPLSRAAREPCAREDKSV